MAIIKVKNNINSELSITHVDNKPAKSIIGTDIAVAVDTINDFSLDANDGDTVIVRDLNRGGTFIYDSSKVAEHNDGTNFNGWIRQYSGAVHVKWFGAKGNGVTDDTEAIQSALDLQEEVFCSAGKYKVTSELVFSDGSKLRGVGVPYGIYPTVLDQEWDMSINSWIYYDGVASDSVCVCRFSDYAVGVEPTGTQLTNQTIAFTDMGIDGNNKAGIGCYYVRPRGEFARYTVRGTTKHAHIFFNLEACSFYDVGAVRNYGKGFTLGYDLYGWTTPPFCDESIFIRPFSMFNGLSATWNVSGNVSLGYGFGVFNSRGVTVVGIESSQNDGAGIYYANEKANVVFLGGYTEFNCTNDSTYEYGVIINGQVGAWNSEFKNINIRDNVRLFGSNPSRDGVGYIFDGCSLIQQVDATISNYKFINCRGDITFSETKPLNIGYKLNNYITNQIIGQGYVSFSSGSAANENYTGIINSVTKNDTGDYTFNLTTDFSSASQFSVQLTTGPNRVIGVYSKSISSVRVQHYSTDGSLIDSNANISITIIANEKL